ncbi:MAG: hypothetical protein WCW02_00115 [Candidatus Buchananbacteria bacterium]
MLGTSHDLLLVVIASCLFLFTLFVCWGMFYLIMIFRDFSKITSSFRKKLELIDGILKGLKERLENTSASMGLLVEGVSKIVKYFQERAEKKETKKKRSK